MLIMIIKVIYSSWDSKRKMKKTMKVKGGDEFLYWNYLLNDLLNTLKSTRHFQNFWIFSHNRSNDNSAKFHHCRQNGTEINNSKYMYTVYKEELLCILMSPVFRKYLIDTKHLLTFLQINGF